MNAMHTWQLKKNLNFFFAQATFGVAGWGEGDPGGERDEKNKLLLYMLNVFYSIFFFCIGNI